MYWMHIWWIKRTFQNEVKTSEEDKETESCLAVGVGKAKATQF